MADFSVCKLCGGSDGDHRVPCIPHARHGTVAIGLYRHHKGDHYFVSSVGTMDVHGHGNPDAPRVVTYHSTRSVLTGLACHHWESDFTRDEVWPDGVTRPRFVRVNP